LAALRAAAGQIGGVQVQNRGTIGGNLCNASPAADGVPPLLALNAMVELVSRRGTRTMPLAQFLLGARRTLLDADEIMSAIIIPAPSPTLRTTFCKLGARQHLVISIAMMAIGLDCQAGRIVDARIAVGACSATALRLTDLEFDLKRCSISDDLADLPSSRHLASLAPIDDVRGTVSYRKAAVLELLRRALPALAKASHTRGMQ
jgi:CO/xanthine dehydrogenase FAD-binding subunit